MAEDNDQQFVPDAEEEIVQMRREEFEELLAQDRAPPAAAPVATPMVPVAPSTSIAGPSSSSKPSFTKSGLARQSDFNSSVLTFLAPMMDFAPEEFEIKSNLPRPSRFSPNGTSCSSLRTRTRMCSIYDQHSRADSMQSSNSILVAFLREKNKKDEKKATQTGNLVSNLIQPPSSPSGSEGRHGHPPSFLTSPSTDSKADKWQLVRIQRPSPHKDVRGTRASTAAGSDPMHESAVESKNNKYGVHMTPWRPTPSPWKHSPDGNACNSRGGARSRDYIASPQKKKLSPRQDSSTEISLNTHFVEEPQPQQFGLEWTLLM